MVYLSVGDRLTEQLISVKVKRKKKRNIAQQSERKLLVDNWNA
jgi:hypothetical protein